MTMSRNSRNNADSDETLTLGGLFVCVLVADVVQAVQYTVYSHNNYSDKGDRSWK